jgi:hypothetical protein
MNRWIASLIRTRSLELSIALALGYALAKLADTVTAIPVSVLAQHVSDADDDLGLFSTSLYYLKFHVGSTAIFYGQLMISTLTLALVLGVAWFVIRRRDRTLGECPYCASRIPYESTHCAYCGSGVSPSVL